MGRGGTGMNGPVVVETGVANLGSLLRACSAVGFPAEATADPGRLRTARAVILPGVGAFGPAMDRLRRRGLDAAVRDAAAAGTPVLGICLGMQLLFEESEEGASPAGAAGPAVGGYPTFGAYPGHPGSGVPGLGWFRGRVVRLDGGRPPGLRVPHMGWNAVRVTAPSPLFAPADAGRRAGTFYFVHSFVGVPDDPEVVCGVAEYGGPFAAAVGRGGVWGVQFHPEKSGADGLSVLGRWLSWAMGPAARGAWSA